MQDTGSTLATYKRLFIPNPFSSDEENEAKKSAQQQEEDAGNAIKDFMTGVWDSLAGTVMGLLTVLAFYRHKKNIKRLLDGTESKIYLSKKNK